MVQLSWISIKIIKISEKHSLASFGFNKRDYITNIKPSYFIFFILQDIFLAMSKLQSDLKSAAAMNGGANKNSGKRSNPESPKPITSIDY